MSQLLASVAGSIAQFLHDTYLSHPFLAVMLQSLIALPLRLLRRRNAWWIGAVFAMAMYCGRERRDCELAGKFHPVEEWYRCWSPWPDWSRDNHLDFWPVLVAALAVALLVTYARRRRG